MLSALVIIAPKGYQDVELAGTLVGLAEAGIDVRIASTETGLCTGKNGGTTEAALALREVDVSMFDRIAFIGGPGAAALRNDKDALRIAKEAVSQDKPLGAICIAPIILAQAGVLKGRRATVWDNQGEQMHFLEEGGAEHMGEAVTIDGRIVTANGPEASVEFGRALASL
jgi:protease I